MIYLAKLNLKIHNVIILIGPTQCGKTTFSKDTLIPQLIEKLKGKTLTSPNVQYIGSDDIRRELLGNASYHKYDKAMLQVSEKAFKTLHARLDAAMEWPHNSQFIVIDTTGLAEEFRSKIIMQAKAAQYNVSAIVFDYKDKSEYEKFVPSEQIDRRLLFKHIDRLHTTVWRTMKRDVYDTIFTIKNKDFSDIEVVVSDVDEYARSLLDKSLKYDVVGDTHGCYAELIDLLIKNGYKFDEATSHLSPPDGRGLILLGDIIDKGPNSFEVLKLAYNHRNEPWFRLIWGNHENFVNKFLNGEIKNASHEDYIEHFDTTELFKDNKDAQTMLNELRSIATNFAQHPDFIATHAPCPARFFGKLDYISTKQMRGQYQRPKRKDYKTNSDYIAALEQSLSFIKDESIHNAPYHVFGHVTTNFPIRYRNKIGIDTGCVSGGHLSMASFTERGVKTFRLQSLQEQTEEFIDLFADRERIIDLAELEPREYGRMRWAARNKVSFISGTMAPADASDNNIESLDRAFDYYRKHGIMKLTLQPKYMGSRCNVYLSENINECFAVSRNGFIIKPDKVNLENVFKTLQNKFKDKLKECKLIVLDGELMPWRALGAGLIDEEFKVVESGVQTELDVLQSSGFEKVLEQTKNELTSSGFVEEANSLSKDQLTKKFGQSKVGTFKNILERPLSPLVEIQSALDIYKEQIKLFGEDIVSTFKPFGILKTVSIDGSEKNYQSNGESNLEQFKTVSEDDYVVVDLNDQKTIEDAHTFFSIITQDRKMEGVVVKPQIIESKVAPALKVRGQRYLTMVYGYDYLMPKKYNRLLKSKHTRKKIETSIREFRIGQKMLSIRQDDIVENNQNYLHLVASMITEEKFGKTLDPRL